ncbi:MAG: hypothetical protein OSB69_16090 [Alphaproteobacteria bacterium]|nr:hypothetical protein [Alphaproteobacteria bacterium]
MAFDLIIRDVCAFGRSDEGPLVDIGISSDRIIDIRPGLGHADEIIEVGGRLVSSGLV